MLFIRIQFLFKNHIRSVEFYPELDARTIQTDLIAVECRSCEIGDVFGRVKLRRKKWEKKFRCFKLTVREGTPPPLSFHRPSTWWPLSKQRKTRALVRPSFPDRVHFCLQFVPCMPSILLFFLPPSRSASIRR